MDFDLLIRNGRVVDGARDVRAAVADVAVRGDRIAAVGRLDGASAARVIDAGGKVVSPGFVDVHVHSEIQLRGYGRKYGGVLQGVTTQLTGPDGFGWAPLPTERAAALWENTLFATGEPSVEPRWPTVQSYLDGFRGKTPANVVPQVPHQAVRMAVLGWEHRPATADEIDRMRAVTREWLAAGARSFCTGLDYLPAGSSNLHELVELSKVVRTNGGIYAAHIRNNDLGEAGAWRETMAISQQAGIPVHISHSSVTEVTAPLLEEAARLCDLTFESYLYPAGCTHLTLMLPIWAQAGGPAEIRRRLADPGIRAELAAYLDRKLSDQLAAGAVPVFAATQTGRFIGQTLSEAAAGRPLGEFCCQLLVEEDPYALMVFHRGYTPERAAAVERATITHPRMLVASDGVYHGPHGHPRGYGCFARILRHCVREQGLLSLEEAVWKMAGFPAERFGIQDRGFLRAGYGADLVIFDPDTVADRSTWAEPWLEPVGVELVVVNGQPVVERGRPTGLLPGRVLT